MANARSNHVLKTCAYAFALLVPLWGAAAQACPDYVKNFHSKLLGNIDVCEAHDRYQAALAKLSEKHFVPAERIGNIMAPRFINLPDWRLKRDRTHARAWYVYDPAPVTWRQWEAGVKLVDARAQSDFEANKLTPFTMQWLISVHAATLDGLLNSAGKLRETWEVGRAVSKLNSLTREQSEGQQSVDFREIANPQRKLVSFHATECFESRPEEFRKSYDNSIFRMDLWPDIAKTNYYLDEKGRDKQCGYLIYAEPQEVGPQLKKWTSYINDEEEKWNSGDYTSDPVFVASRAQRWFIAIHPFERGNGRMSRFVMDWLVKSIGLPAPILTNMDNDMYSDEMKWADEVGKGILRTISYAEFCALRPDGRGCALISTAQDIK